MVNFTLLVKNRPRLTEQALKSILFEPETVNFTITGSEIEHETSDIVRAWTHQQKDAVFIDGLSPSGTGQLRNFVIHKAAQTFGKGDYLYLSDNDVFFYPYALEKLVMIYEFAWEKNFKVLGAVNHPYHRPVSEYPFVWQGQECSRVQEVQALALQSMLMKWEVWDKYGPFDETPVGRVRMSEDVAFTNKIRADGGRIGVISPALAVNTGITDSFGEKIPGWELVQKQVPPGVYAE